MSAHWGIWNDVDKRFVFGVDEPSMKAAEAKFAAVCGSPSWRYRVKEIPRGWKNPRNRKYARKG